MEKNTGLKRLIYASQYSWQGLKSGLINEAAFLQEFVAFIVLTIVTFFLDITARTNCHDYQSNFSTHCRNT